MSEKSTKHHIGVDDYYILLSRASTNKSSTSESMIDAFSDVWIAADSDAPASVSWPCLCSAVDMKPSPWIRVTLRCSIDRLKAGREAYRDETEDRVFYDDFSLCRDCKEVVV